MNDNQTTVSDLRQIVQTFVEERKWQHFHNAKNITMALSVEAAELLEHFQWLSTEQVLAREGYEQSAVAEELSDVLCYALSLANSLDIDISQAIEAKMAKNRLKYPVTEPT